MLGGDQATPGRTWSEFGIGANLSELASEIADQPLRIIIALQIEPDLGGPRQKTLQAKGGFWSDRAFPLDDLIDTSRRHSDFFGQAVLRKAQWFHEIFGQNFSRMNGVLIFSLSRISKS
jgi:hypothetical protein